LFDELRRMAPKEVGFRRRLALDEREAVVQHGNALLRFGMPAGRVEADERAVAYELRCRSSRISRGDLPLRPTR
jgi:hypothetical protein